MQANLLASKPVWNRNGAINTLQTSDLPIHGWYRFVLSYPPHLVRQYASVFGLSPTDLLLDPFCGTGTTLVGAKKNSIPSVGCDAHPFAVLASSVKSNWMLNTKQLRDCFRQILRQAERIMSKEGLESLSFAARMLQEPFDTTATDLALSEEEQKLLPTGFMSARPLRRLLVLRDKIEEWTKDLPTEVRNFFFLALAHVIANGAGNFAFGPEIYRTKPKRDYDVLGHFARRCDTMMNDLVRFQSPPPNSCPK